MKKRFIIFFVLIALILSSCSSGKKSDYTSNPQTELPQTNYPSQPSEDDNREKKNEESGMTEEVLPQGEDGATGESYLTIKENPTVDASEESTLTFSLKVDTASYSNVQRYLDNGSLPPVDAVRVEEMINYFSYDEPMEFTKDNPFAVYTEIGASILDDSKYFVLARVKTKEVDKKDLPSSNITFLIDTSGSMYSHDKLPLLQESFALLVDTLDENDRVSIVTYAGSSDVLLKGTHGDSKDEIINAINNLKAEGTTAGGEGITTAYELAEKNFIKGGNNRVILATDGDFNVGMSSNESLSDLISSKRDSGIYLSILGFGTGNIRDDLMETLSKDGNGNYAYINNISTAKKVLVEELGSSLFTVADDVKAQVEFNPKVVKNYRLIGYENRSLNNEDFEDDTKDAGEIGVGTDVVALFEVELQNISAKNSDKLLELRIRYKDPGMSTSKLVSKPVSYGAITLNNTSDFKFASAVAAFGHIIRDSDYAKDVRINDILKLAKDNIGDDNGGYRKEFLAMLDNYIGIVG